MKLLLAMLSGALLLGTASASAQNLNRCTQYDAACAAEFLIENLGQESRNVRVRRLVNRMNQQCAYDNVKCTSRFVNRAIRQAFGRDDGRDDDDRRGSTYTVTANEKTNNNYTRIAWCEPGDIAISGNCTGFHDPNWAGKNGKITRSNIEGWQCHNHRKRINMYEAVVTCQRR